MPKLVRNVLGVLAGIVLGGGGGVNTALDLVAAYLARAWLGIQIGRKCTNVASA
jgi:hypothetical protein